MEESGETGFTLVKSRKQPSVMLYETEEAFDFVALLIEFSVYFALYFPVGF